MSKCQNESHLKLPFLISLSTHIIYYDITESIYATYLSLNCHDWCQITLLHNKGYLSMSSLRTINLCQEIVQLFCSSCRTTNQNTVTMKLKL